MSLVLFFNTRGPTPATLITFSPLALSSGAVYYFNSLSSKWHPVPMFAST